MGCTLQVLRKLFGVIANLLQLSLKCFGDWPRFLHNVRKHVIPIFVNSKKEDSENRTLSVSPWLWGMWWRKYLKLISRYLRWCLGVVSTNSQQRKSSLTNLIAFYEEHLTGWGETNGQGPRQPDLGSLLQQGASDKMHSKGSFQPQPFCDCVKCICGIAKDYSVCVCVLDIYTK